MKIGTKLIYIGLVLCLVVGLALGCAKPETIVLKAISCVKPGHTVAVMYEESIKRINERANGELFIDFLGGPEAIPADDQLSAVATGVVDMTFMASSWIIGSVPECMAFDFRNVETTTPARMRETGWYDLMVEVFKEHNIFYLGESIAHGDHYIYTLSRVANLADFKGLRLRSGGQFDTLYHELGISSVTVPYADLYIALERGVIDGIAIMPSGMVTKGLHEILPYAVDQPLATTGGIHILNLDTWQALPKHLQDLIIEVQLEVEKEAADISQAALEEAIKVMKGAGMEFVKFSPEEAKVLVDTFNRTNWERVKGIVSPEMYNKLWEASGN